MVLISGVTFLKLRCERGTPVPTEHWDTVGNKEWVWFCEGEQL